tara:strand:- start:987 stop:1259 length:273 start_codon:yes stop_codon:yes gene_type:complete
MNPKEPDVYDGERLKRIRDDLAFGKKTFKVEDLSYCIRLIKELRDENLSLWDMLDEIKKSDAENFVEALEKASILAAAERYLRGMKPEEA